jgi:hypothetical protein
MVPRPQRQRARGSTAQHSTAQQIPNGPFKVLTRGSRAKEALLHDCSFPGTWQTLHLRAGFNLCPKGSALQDARGDRAPQMRSSQPVRRYQTPCHHLSWTRTTRGRHYARLTGSPTDSSLRSVHRPGLAGQCPWCELNAGHEGLGKSHAGRALRCIPLPETPSPAP